MSGKKELSVTSRKCSVEECKMVGSEVTNRNTTVVRAGHRIMQLNVKTYVFRIYVT